MNKPIKLEDFLKGKPLTEELRVLSMAPADPPRRPVKEEISGKMPPPVMASKEEVKRDERAWLQHLTVQPGWPVFTQLLDQIIADYERDAMILSKEDPFGNQRDLSNAWAYVAVAEKVKAELGKRIGYQIALLSQKTEDENG